MEPFTNGEWLARVADARALRVQRVRCGTGSGCRHPPLRGFPRRAGGGRGARGGWGRREGQLSPEGQHRTSR